MIRQRLCDSLYAAGRMKDAGESLLKMTNTIDEEGSMSDPFIKWVSGEFMFYLFVCYTLNLFVRLHLLLSLRSWE